MGISRTSSVQAARSIVSRVECARSRMCSSRCGALKVVHVRASMESGPWVPYVEPVFLADLHGTGVQHSRMYISTRSGVFTSGRMHSSVCSFRRRRVPVPGSLPSVHGADLSPVQRVVVWFRWAVHISTLSTPVRGGAVWQLVGLITRRS